MAQQNKSNSLTEGSVARGMLLFAIPIFISNLFQQLYNAADSLIVGNFLGGEALAAVGSTGSLNNLIVNVFMGLSIGTSIMVARYYGAQDWKSIREIVHTSMLVSFICGVALIFIGIFLAAPLLELMGTPPECLDQAVLYMRIIFIGMPAQMVYNFGAAILRAVGDTRRPLLFLLAAGIVNVLLNLFFVIVFHMDTAGVALATIISQSISAVLVVLCLMRSHTPYRLRFRRLRVRNAQLLQIIRVGLPAGIQGAVFSVSNVLIQSSINSFGSLAVGGNTAASNIEGFVYTAMNAVYQTNLSFTSQNVGAGKLQRVVPILLRCLGVVLTVGVGLSGLALLFNHQLLGIYSSDQEVIRYGLGRLEVVCATYFLCGMMDVVCGSVRGLGSSVVPTIVSLTGACGLRILWIYTIFAENRTLFFLYLSYPITWVITFSAHLVCFFIFLHRRKKRAAQALQELPQDASA